MNDFSSSWFDLTSRQRSIWLDIKASDDHRLFQVGACTKFTQALDLDVLRRAVADVTLRHDALRLVIDTDAPRQRVAASASINVRSIDFSQEAESETAVLRYIDELFESPFDLNESSLVQVIVASAGARGGWLILRIHHIVIDAVSFSLAFKDIVETYNSLLAGAQASRPSSSYLPFQRQDARHNMSSRARRDLEYWQNRLSNLPPPLFYKRKSERTASAGRPLLRREISFSYFQQFRAQCASQNVRPGNVLLALSAWLLASARGKDEFVLGVAYPGRGKEDQETIGIFSGVMPLRVTVPAETSALELATLITQSLNRDYLHYRTPIDDIRRNLRAEQRHRSPLIDAMVSFMPLDVVDFDADIGTERVRIVPLRGLEANPLSIYVSELNTDAPVSIEFSFDPAYLRDDQVGRLVDNFCALLDAFIRQPLGPMAQADQIPDDGVGAMARPASNRRIRIVSTFTSEPLAEPLQFWLRRTGIDCDVEFAGYNQIFQELLDPASLMRRNRLGANVVLVRLEDWLRERPASDSLSGDAQFLEKTADDFIAALRRAALESHVPWLLLISAPSPEWDLSGTRAQIQQRLMEKIVAGLRDVRGLDIATYLEWRDLYCVDVEHDATGDQLGHIPYTPRAFAAIATLAARRIHLSLRSPIKVVVVDCDNTLWEGVVGEDGPHGIGISDSHRQLQQRLVHASKCGVLICLCSKNIEEDVTAVLNQRADMVLKPEHLIGHKVNWKAKSENIRELARELELGLDSFLFLDDNPVEVAEVAASCPEVLGLVVNMSQPGGTKIDHLWPLDCVATTAEDAKRVNSYRNNLSRQREREKATDFASFIEGLNLRILAEEPSQANLARLAQLTERTNQFNINNAKRSGVELAEKAASGTGAVRAFRVSDKFGDYGIVGLFSVQKEGRDLLVDTFLMSCRVLGRGVEHRMIAEIGRLAIEFGATNVRIPVRVTDRNLPVRQFLSRVDGQHLTEGNEQLHVIAAEAAAAFRFRPEEHTEGREDDTETPVPLNQLGRSDAETWIETATTLASVEEIERAIRAATISDKQPVRISRFTQTETEKILEEMFCHALGLEAVGADDDFFDLGVHSLMAVQLVSRLRDRFGFQMSIRALFECSTIAKLAKAIEQQKSSGYQPIVPLQAGDSEPALFCCHPANGDAVCYMRLTKAIGADQTIYGFEASGLSPGETMARSLSEMAAVYVKEMIAVQPKGPYHLLGWSFGGALAFEIAKQLYEAGHEVGFVGFMDAVAPEKGEIAPELRETDEPAEYRPEHEIKLLEIIATQLNTMRRYAKMPPMSEEGVPITWKQAIEGFQSMGVVPEDYSIDEMKRKMLVYANCAILFKRYRPSALPIPLVHFQASKNLPEWDFDWSPYTAIGVRTVWIRCSHFRMGFEPNTTLIAAHLRACIRGDRSALRWWQNTPIANRMNEVIGRLSLKRA
jgi:FkbH-like protein